MPGVIADFVRRPPLRRDLDSSYVLGEKVLAASAAGQISFLPYLDRFTEETETIRLTYRAMLKSPVVKAALLGKVFAVASLDLQMHPANEDNPRDREIADFCRYAFTQALGHVEVDTDDGHVHAATEGGFASLCETILMAALIDKFSVSNKVWYRDVWPRGRWTGKRFYRGLKAKDGAYLEQDEFRNITGVRSRRFGGVQKPDVEDPRDFVIYRHLPLFEGAGMSDFRAAYGAYWRLDTVEKLRVIHLEKFTSPYFKGTYTDPDKDAPLLASALEAAKSRNWIMVPSSVQVECMTLATRGEAEFDAACRAYREDIALAIAGAFLQMLTAQGGGGEMRGDANTQRGTAELFVWHLAAKLTGVIDRQLTPDLVDHNYGGGVDYPTCTLGGINYGELKAGIELDEIAQRMGAPLSKKAFAKKYALQLAATPDDKLEAVPMAGVGGGFGGGGFGSPFGDDSSDPTLPAPVGDQAAAASLDSSEQAASAGDVQATALNGAQIAALLEITGSIVTGELTQEAARLIILQAFPLMDPLQIQALVRSVKPALQPAGQVPGQVPGQAAFTEAAAVAGGDIAAHAQQLGEHYGGDAVRAVIQATAALLSGGDGGEHTFSEPRLRRAAGDDPSRAAAEAVQLAIDAETNSRETAALADILHAIKTQPAPVVNVPAPPPAPPAAKPVAVRKTVQYDAEGRVVGIVETPILE